AFGVLKRRFRILVSRPEYSYTAQSKIVCVAAALHNFLRIHEPMNFLDNDNDEYDADNHPFLTNAAVVPGRRVLAVTQAETDRANARRHAIMSSMWEHYVDERDN
ncbi:hypothetical protein GGX14DRAFT_343098, partial [Mycena pura]